MTETSNDVEDGRLNGSCFFRILVLAVVVDVQEVVFMGSIKSFVLRYGG